VEREIEMKTILIVDDSRAVRLASRRVVAGLGFEVLEAEDGRAALERLSQHPEVDVVLLDWNMPVLDGISCLREIRTPQRSKQPVVVMCTTENDVSRIVEAIEAGADEYIMKPFTSEIVEEKFTAAGLL
jgi:two-component system chemotaxis response regulator CheY